MYMLFCAYQADWYNATIASASELRSEICCSQKYCILLFDLYIMEETVIGKVQKILK